MCVFFNALKRKANKRSYPLLKQAGNPRDPEVRRGQSSAHPSLKGMRQNNSSRTKKGPKEPQII